MRRLLVLLPVLLLSGGCAAFKMSDAKVVASVPEDKAVVTFNRPMKRAAAQIAIQDFRGGNVKSFA